MALLHFACGRRHRAAMSWDVLKHGHPPIELYGTEGSLRVPDPNFFGGAWKSPSEAASGGRST